MYNLVVVLVKDDDDNNNDEIEEPLGDGSWSRDPTWTIWLEGMLLWWIPKKDD